MAALKIFILIITILILILVLAIFVNHIAPINTKINSNVGDITNASEQNYIEWGGDKEDIRRLNQTIAYYDRAMENVQIQSADGLSLSGKYILGESTDYWVLLIHGYTASNHTMFTIADHYYKRGYSILAPDQRGHGQSQGVFSTFGVKEKSDMVLWIAWIKKSYPYAKIILHGESMGSTTALYMVEDNPKEVIACIDDCGFLSYYELYRQQIEKYAGILTYPAAKIANIFIKYILGGDAFKSAADSVKKTRIPCLFINGYKDELVPVEACYQAYENHPGKKKIYISAALHAESKLLDQDTYYREVFDFIDQAKRDLEA